jgi:hypothetical protein
MEIIKKFLPLLLIIGLSYFAIKPLFMSGSFPIHDDTQVARVFEMSKALTDGMFPVRWVADLGYHYGYPIFNFYAPFAYYIGGLFHIIGFDALSATKIMMGLGMVLAGIFMYFFAKDFWGKLGGIIAALFYIYAPFHAVDLYVRGDLAEVWAYAFIPLAFYGLWNAYSLRKWKYVIFGSIGFAGVILSHNLTAMMITPFLFLAALLFYLYARQEERINKPYYPIIILFIGLLLAAFYWIPVFAEMKYTNVLSQLGGGADYKDHFVCLRQLWDSPWGFGGSTHGCIDGLSYKIGKFHILFSLFALFAGWILWRQDKRKFGFVVIIFISLLFSIFLMQSPSKFIWDSIPQMAFFQFPWRFLLVISFFISFLGGAGIWLAKKYIRFSIFYYIFVGIVGFYIIYLNSEVFVPQMYQNKNASDYTNTANLQWNTSRISDEYMPPAFIKPINPAQVPQNKISPKTGVIIDSLEEKTQRIEANITTKTKTDILIYHAYFPGWHVYIDGKQEYFKYFNRGLIVTIPEGTHNLVVKFSQTPIEKIANIVSLTGVFILFLGIIVTLRRQKKHAKKST